MQRPAGQTYPRTECAQGIKPASTRNLAFGKATCARRSWPSKWANIAAQGRAPKQREAPPKPAETKKPSMIVGPDGRSGFLPPMLGDKTGEK